MKERTMKKSILVALVGLLAYGQAQAGHDLQLEVDFPGNKHIDSNTPLYIKRVLANRYPNLQLEYFRLASVAVQIRKTDGDPNVWLEVGYSKSNSCNADKDWKTCRFINPKFDDRGHWQIQAQNDVLVRRMRVNLDYDTYPNPDDLPYPTPGPSYPYPDPTPQPMPMVQELSLGTITPPRDRYVMYTVSVNYVARGPVREIVLDGRGSAVDVTEVVIEDIYGRRHEVYNLNGRYFTNTTRILDLAELGYPRSGVPLRAIYITAVSPNRGMPGTLETRVRVVRPY